jgi:membrane protein
VLKKTWAHVRAALGLVGYLLYRFFDDGMATRASSLAYTVILSLVPVLVVSLSVIGLIPGMKDWRDRIQDFVVSNFVASSAKTVDHYLHVFVQHVHQLSFLSVLLFVVITLMTIFSVTRAFNAIWRVVHHRRFWPAVGTYSTVLISAPIFLGVGFYLNSYLARVAIVDLNVTNTTAIYFLLHVVPYGLSFCTFFLLNWLLPAVHVPVRAALFGALITTILFESAKTGFAYYVSGVANYRVLYGALALIPVFLLWVYVVWCIILFGGLITHVCVVGRRERWAIKDEEQSVVVHPQR